MSFYGGTLAKSLWIIAMLK